LLSAPSLELDPTLELQDRFGNLGILRLWELSQTAEGSSGCPSAGSAPASPKLPMPTTGTPVTHYCARTPDHSSRLANPYRGSYALATVG
jgi:hypothetical protein